MHGGPGGLAGGGGCEVVPAGMEIPGHLLEDVNLSHCAWRESSIFFFPSHTWLLILVKEVKVTSKTA